MSSAVSSATLGNQSHLSTPPSADLAHSANLSHPSLGGISHPALLVVEVVLVRPPWRYVVSHTRTLLLTHSLAWYSVAVVDKVQALLTRRTT